MSINGNFISHDTKINIAKHGPPNMYPQIEMEGGGSVDPVGAGSALA